MKVTDVIGATTLATGDSEHDKDDRYDRFVTIRKSAAGQAFRGVALAPEDRDVDHHGDHDHDGDDRYDNPLPVSEKLDVTVRRSAMNGMRPWHP